MAEPVIPQGEQRRFLIVRSGGVRCAIPALAVRRVVRGLPITTVPGSARQLLGLAHHDGDAIAVLDLLNLLGSGVGDAARQTGLTVVTRVGPAGKELVGLAVDEAIEVASLEVSDLPSSAGGPVRGEVMMGEQTVRVLDPGALGSEG